MSPKHSQTVFFFSSYVLLLTSYVLLPTSYVSSEALAENQARFGVITGDVGLLSQGAKEWITPHEGLPIEPGDRIRTGEDGRVDLVIGENAFWALEPETELVTEHMEINAGRFSLVSGALLGRVDSARTAGTIQRWEFDTPLTVAFVRGTEFALTFDTSPVAHLGVFEGAVELQPAETAAGLEAPVRISAGQEAVARRGKPVKTFAAFSAGMQTLAAKRRSLERRQTQIQNTWSPFTPAVRAEARTKFVAPPPQRPRGKIPIENSSRTL